MRITSSTLEYTCVRYKLPLLSNLLEFRFPSLSRKRHKTLSWFNNYETVVWNKKSRAPVMFVMQGDMRWSVHGCLNLFLCTISAPPLRQLYVTSTRVAILPTEESLNAGISALLASQLSVLALYTRVSRLGKTIFFDTSLIWGYSSA